MKWQLQRHRFDHQRPRVSKLEAIKVARAIIGLAVFIGPIIAIVRFVAYCTVTDVCL